MLMLRKKVISYSNLEFKKNIIIIKYKNGSTALFN